MFRLPSIAAKIRGLFGPAAVAVAVVFVPITAAVYGPGIGGRGGLCNVRGREAGED